MKFGLRIIYFDNFIWKFRTRNWALKIQLPKLILQMWRGTKSFQNGPEKTKRFLVSHIFLIFLFQCFSFFFEFDDFLDGRGFFYEWGSTSSSQNSRLLGIYPYALSWGLRFFIFQCRSQPLNVNILSPNHCLIRKKIFFRPLK